MRGGITTDKNFLGTMKHFLTNKGHINSNEIIIKKGSKAITEGRELPETFSKHYVNIVENISGKKPTHVARDNNIFVTDQGVELIKQSFLGHSSVSRIKQNLSVQRFPCCNEICLTTPHKILKLLIEIETKKTVSFDMIPSRILKIAAHVLCGPLAKAINNKLLQGDNNIFDTDQGIELIKQLFLGHSSFSHIKKEIDSCNLS